MQRVLWVVVAMSLLTGCGGGGGDSAQPSGPRTVRVSWSANPEAAVNREGGGYRVYYSTQAGFDIGDANVIDRPYSGGEMAPTSAELTLDSGHYYFRVVAYSALNPGGSDTSRQVDIVVP